MQTDEPSDRRPHDPIKITSNNNTVDNSLTSINNDQPTQISLPTDGQADAQTSIADIIGEFGLYQLSLTLLTFVRYALMAMMTNAGPLLAPSVDFWCQPPTEVASLLPDKLKPRAARLNLCLFELTNGTRYRCNHFQFSESSGVTLTDSFGLACDRDWLRSAFQSTISAGVVAASVIWGSFSDRHGRSFTIKVCFIFSLVFSTISYLSDNFTLFAASRSLSSFGDLGLVVSLSTIIVELLGNKYRGATGLVVYTGWSFGVMIMPWLVDYYRNYSKSMLFLIMMHVISLPWLLTVGESPRWLLVNGHIEEAGEELRRVSKWNLKVDKQSLNEVDRKFDLLKAKFVPIVERRKARQAAEEAKMSKCQIVLASLFGGLNKVGEIFKTRELTITALTLIWTTFNSEFLYMLTIMINSDIGDNVKLNYAIGGIMETLATLTSIWMASYITRRFALSFTLSTISALCLTLALTHQMSNVSIWILNLTKLAVSTLSSMVYITTTEVFPTSLRQTGFGLSGTLGSLGAMVAPFVRTELADKIGLTRVLMIVMLLPLSAAVIIPYFLRETKNVELSDDVDDLENDSDYVMELQPKASVDPSNNKEAHG